MISKLLRSEARSGITTITQILRFGPGSRRGLFLFSQIGVIAGHRRSHRAQSAGKAGSAATLTAEKSSERRITRSLRE
jgi:hypothetical protein